MLSVIHPGWLLLLVCGIVLLLVGCAAFPTRYPTRTPTPYPPVTLTVVAFATESPQPRSTRPAPSVVPVVPTPRWTATRTASSGARADDPTCYSSPNRGYMCLGRVWNETAATLSNVMVRVALFGDSENLLAQQTIGLEQRYLPPDSSAPYRALFAQIGTQGEKARADIEQVGVVSESGQALSITGERGVLAESGRYVVTANIRNSSQRLAEHVRLIVTLLDTDDRVIGYRVYQVEDPLPAQSERALRVEVFPHVIRENIRHISHIEAWNGD